MQQLVNSLTVGAVYALVTVGYSMVFSVLDMINFAHTDMMMLGAYAGYLVARSGGGLFAQIAVGMSVGAVASAVVERTVYRRLRGKAPLKTMTAAIAVSVILQYSVMMAFTAQPRAYPAGNWQVTQLFGAKTTSIRILAIAVSAVCFVALALLVSKTRAGLEMRATAQDPIGAMAVGIDRNKVISTTFLIGGAAAGLAGVMYGNIYLITPLMGANIGIKAFVCTVAGGKGSLWGAVLGALLLSFSETAVCTFLGSGYKDAVCFAVLIVVLLLSKTTSHRF